MLPPRLPERTRATDPLAEIVIKATTGVVLVIAPLIALALAGIQKPDTGFWLRVVSALVLAIAASVWMGSNTRKHAARLVPRRSSRSI
jgi:ABC-type nickel/cobalt efflux system permease component RcnA